MKSSRRDKATAVAVVALLHGAALLCFSQSMQHMPPQQHPAAALPPTLIRVSLGTIEAPRQVHERVSHRQASATKRVTQSPAESPAAQPEQTVAAFVGPAAAASAPASTPVRKEPEASFTEVAYLDNPPPIYPSASLRVREQGLVLVSVLVSGQGFVAEAAVKESSGSARLDAAALTSVRAWRFVAAKRSGVAVEARINVPVRFELSAD